MAGGCDGVLARECDGVLAERSDGVKVKGCDLAVPEKQNKSGFSKYSKSRVVYMECPRGGG